MILKDFAGLDGVYKLHDGPDPAGLMGRVLKRADLRPDLARMSCEIVLTKEVEDRSGDIVTVRGIDLSDHRMHPIGLFNHDKDAPLGRFADPSGGYTVKAVGDTLRGELFFNQNSAFAHDVFQCVVDKTFTAASIGFLPVHGAVNKRHPRGTHYGRARLVEGSIVTIGDNPHAGIEAVHKALGRPGASEIFKSYLLPLVPARPAAVVSGWDGDEHTPGVRKAMNDTTQGGTAPDPMQPQPDPTAMDDEHGNAVDDGIGTIMASIYQKFTAGELDEKAALKQFAKLLETHSHVSDLDGNGVDDDAEGDDLDEDSLADDEDVDLSDDEPDDYEDDDGDDGPDPFPPKKGKKKHILIWNQKSVAVGTDAHIYIDREAPTIAEPYQKLLGIVHKAIEAGKPIGRVRLGELIEKADRIAGKTLAKGEGIIERMNADFGPVRKAIRRGTLVVKAAPVAVVQAAPADDIPDDMLERLTNAYEGIDARAKKVLGDI